MVARIEKFERRLSLQWKIHFNDKYSCKSFKKCTIKYYHTRLKIKFSIKLSCNLWVHMRVQIDRDFNRTKWRACKIQNLVNSRTNLGRNVTMTIYISLFHVVGARGFRFRKVGSKWRRPSRGGRGRGRVRWVVRRKNTEPVASVPCNRNKNDIEAGVIAFLFIRRGPTVAWLSDVAAPLVAGDIIW